MKSFQVFEHPTQGYQAVKNGFSWPAFFFTWIWAFVKSMWGEGAIIIVFTIMISFLGGLSPVLPLIVGLCFNMFIGSRGNEWYKVNLNKRGFELLRTVNAVSCETAIAMMVKKELNKSDAHKEQGNEHLFLEANKEFEENNIDEALWIKILTLLEGNEKKAKFEYIKQRVCQMQAKEVEKIEKDLQNTKQLSKTGGGHHWGENDKTHDVIKTCPQCNDIYHGAEFKICENCNCSLRNP